MKVSKSAKFSALFFLIFIFGIIVVVTSINRSLEKKTEIFKKEQPTQPVTIASTYQE